MTIQAIQTEYKGYKFRSRLEARWAVFLDTLGVAFDYEPEGFDLGEVGYYLPDFYLPEKRLWLEIKPDEPTHDEKWKAKTFAELSKQNIAILQGRLTTPEIEYLEGWEFQVTRCTYSATVYHGELTDQYDPTVSMRYDTLPDWLREHGVDAPDFDGSIECARVLKHMNYEVVAKDPKTTMYAPRHLYGICSDNLIWSLHQMYDYTLRWNTTTEGGWLRGRLAGAYERAQQARFEHGQRL